MTNNTNILETVRAWTDIVEQIWADKIVKLKIHDTFEGLDSIMDHISENNGMPTSIEFSFNYYMKFADMGVGKGTPIGSVNENRTTRREGQKQGNQRRPKPWYASTMYAERMKLSEILAEKYAHRAAITICENVDDNAERWITKTI